MQSVNTVKIIPVCNVRKMFSLEWPTIFLPSPFSYNHSSCSFVYVIHLFIIELQTYSINFMTLNYTLLYQSHHILFFEVIVNVNRL